MPQHVLWFNVGASWMYGQTHGLWRGVALFLILTVCACLMEKLIP